MAGGLKVGDHRCPFQCRLFCDSVKSLDSKRRLTWPLTYTIKSPIKWRSLTLQFPRKEKFQFNTAAVLAISLSRLSVYISILGEFVVPCEMHYHVIL